MIWLVWIAILVLVVVQVKLWRSMKETRAKVDAHGTMLIQMSARTSHTVQQRVSRKNPQVDAAARTTKRDSHDLPLTGRMSQGLHREKSNSVRLTDDS